MFARWSEDNPVKLRGRKNALALGADERVVVLRRDKLQEGAKILDPGDF